MFTSLQYFNETSSPLLIKSSTILLNSLLYLLTNWYSLVQELSTISVRQATKFSEYYPCSIFIIAVIDGYSSWRWPCSQRITASWQNSLGWYFFSLEGFFCRVHCVPLWDSCVCQDCENHRFYQRQLVTLIQFTLSSCEKKLFLSCCNTLPPNFLVIFIRAYAMSVYRNGLL